MAEKIQAVTIRQPLIFFFWFGVSFLDISERQNTLWHGIPLFTVDGFTVDSIYTKPIYSNGCSMSRDAIGQQRTINKEKALISQGFWTTLNHVKLIFGVP
jgi:hypothetical protein